MRKTQGCREKARYTEGRRTGVSVQLHQIDRDGFAHFFFSTRNRGLSGCADPESPDISESAAKQYFGTAPSLISKRHSKKGSEGVSDTAAFPVLVNVFAPKIANIYCFTINITCIS